MDGLSNIKLVEDEISTTFNQVFQAPGSKFQRWIYLQQQPKPRRNTRKLLQAIRTYGTFDLFY